ncbi:MAG: NifB/NifX family molybdenum-iron cluster-binding protein [Desulfovermiculus sp.]|nr:NifB/NifX family molybdenum-iron cluster-binding protein [Desulfovermiculus sp.]
MKIAVSSQGQDLNSALDPRFGRAAGFIVYDNESGAYEYVSNHQNLQAMQGAGIQTAQNVAQTGVKAVISGHVGPKAFSALQAGGIDIYLSQSGTVQEALDALKAGKLEKTQDADKPGHW